jgi:hypothetical protein
MYNLQKLILGAFASFVEDGTSVGDPPNTVGADFFPSADDYSEAWNSLGCVSQSSLEPKVETDIVSCPSPAGGYIEEETENVVADVIKLSLRDHSEPIFRMIWGLTAPVEDGTPVAPFANKDRFVKGWLNFTLRGQDGQDRIVAALYGKLRMDANPTWSKDPTKPAVKFQVLYSPIAAIVPDQVEA